MSSDRVIDGNLPPAGIARAAEIIHRLIGLRVAVHPFDFSPSELPQTLLPAGSRSGEGAHSVLPYLNSPRA